MPARPNIVGAVYVAGAVLALANSGCLAVAVGACAGGAGVAAHAYCKGKVSQVYIADLPDALAASRTALAEMQMPLEKEKDTPDHIVLRSHTGDGDRVRIDLCRQPSRIPADGPVTEISVRVATFGDRPLSGRILYQISAHLLPPGAAPASPTPTPLPMPPPGPPVTSSSAPPSSPPPTMPPLAPPPRPVEPPLAK